MVLPSQRLVWFAAAIVVPCAALLYLGLRLLAQDEEIARQRAREVTQGRFESLRRDLQTALEPMRLAPTVPAGVAFHGVIRDGRVYLAWELQPAVEQMRRALSDSGYQVLLRGASTGEVTKLPGGAAREFLTLQRAVSMDRNGQREAAKTLFARVAVSPVAITDDYGVPLALYAIPRLPASARAPALAATMRSILSNPNAPSPTALRLSFSLARETGLNEAAALETALEDARASEDFQRTYPSTGGASTVRWQTLGEPPFLVGFAATPVPGEFTFRAVRTADMAVTLPIQPRFSSTEGLLLGEPFHGLRATLPELTQEATPRQRPFVIAVLAIAFSMALLGSLLWWRDFRREAQLAFLRTQFVAGVSHELRTPLTAIRMFTEALHDNPTLDQATRQGYLSTMLQENERLSRLVENVLEFSRIERNKQKYQLRRVALPAVVQSVVSAYRPLLEQGGFHLQTAIDESLPDVQADPDALGQALSNLLGNAMKFSGKAREISLEAGREGGRAVIRVTDHGIGIPQAEQRRIFESFYRASVPENKSIQGAGLGLTLVRHVAEGHRGEIQVKSELGQGSTFTLLLPIPAEGPIE